MNASDARRIALDVLVRVAAGKPSDRSLDDALRRAELMPRDRGLATELVYGVLRRRQSLDRRIASHSRRPLPDLDVAVLEALRIGAYQICHLDRVPSHAAVGATVDAAKAHNPAAAGFVNAVLRGLARQGCGEPDVRDAFADIPPWWAERWVSRYGEEAAAAWFAATLEPAPLALRAHPRVVRRADLPGLLCEQGVETVPSALVHGALRVVSGNPVGTDLLRRGAFSLRSEAGQLVAALLPAGSSDRVLDACAGRGGKALQIAEDARPRAIVAADVSRWRVAACRRAARAAGIDEVSAVVADLSSAVPFSRSFSAVLVDAPCSGLGTVRRRPEIKWRNDPERLRRLARLQRRILHNSADALAAGGSLLYATCSTEPQENEEVVAAVLAERNDLAQRPVGLPVRVDRGSAAGGADLVDVHGYFRTYPRHTDMDGFFAALLVKTR